MERQLIIGNKNYSSWSLRAWLALVKTGLPFEEILVPLSVPGTRQQLLSLSPAGKVPALREGGVVIWDSLAIIERLAEASPGLWPKDGLARAIARSVSAEMHSGFAALRTAMPMNCRATGRHVKADEDVRRDIERIQAIWSDCRERFGKNGPWLFGDFSAADAMYAPVVSRFHTYGVETSPVVAAYMQTVLDDPDMQRWYADAKTEAATIGVSEVGIPNPAFFV
ncbi:MAG: glutathione S-transferase family protein [Betaproteobacteria bacterium]